MFSVPKDAKSFEMYAKTIFGIYCVSQNVHVNFCDFRRKKNRKKFSFTPIIFKLGFAYVSEDSKKMEKNRKKIFLRKKFGNLFFEIYFSDFFS